MKLQEDILVNYSNKTYFNETIEIKINNKTVKGYTNRNSSLVKVGSLYYAKKPTKKIFVLDARSK